MGMKSSFPPVASLAASLFLRAKWIAIASGIPPPEKFRLCYFHTFLFVWIAHSNISLMANCVCSAWMRTCDDMSQWWNNTDFGWSSAEGPHCRSNPPGRHPPGLRSPPPRDEEPQPPSQTKSTLAQTSWADCPSGKVWWVLRLTKLSKFQKLT